MNKLSFFKLPLIIVSIIGIYKIFLYSEIKKIFTNEEIYLFVLRLISHILMLDLLYWILPLFVLSFAYYRAKVNIVTVKNVLITIIIAIVMVIVDIFIENILQKIWSEAYFYYQTSYKAHMYLDIYRLQLIMSILSFVMMLIYNTIFYYLIVVLGRIFDRNPNNEVFTSKQVQFIHFILSLLLIYFFVLMSIKFSNAYFYYIDLYWGITWLLASCILIITALIIVFAIKNLFNKPYKQIEIGKVIKVATIPLFLSSIINAVIMIFILLVSYLLIRNGKSNAIYLGIFILIMSGVLQLYIFISLIRRFVKAYFSNNNQINNQTLTKSTNI
ncbi:hypothetical protein RCS94_04295 [Orbaceae bacterium ac157xtp]